MAKNFIIEQIVSSQEDILSPLQFNLIKKLESDGPLTRRQLVRQFFNIFTFRESPIFLLEKII
ncbi:MAG: hypothetical protein P8Y70_06730 [Candidatus Lokiarchaeota archaeon]